MNIKDIKIPVAFQFTMDDVGWIEGRTPYWEGFQPTRTGIPRRHVLADYQVVNEIGKLANMKICGMFVLGDWDRNGILKDVACATKEGKNWKGSIALKEKNLVDIANTNVWMDNKEDWPELINKEQTEIVEFLNSCEYIEMAYHGLMHECWDEDGNCMSAEFVPPADLKPGNERGPAPEWYVRQHLDAFREIYKDWGFTKELRSFTCPGHCLNAWKDGSYTKILKDYGIKYWQEPYVTHPFVDNGVMLNKMPGWIAVWEAYDINPDKLPTYTEENAGIICTHWPNFLRHDPDRNFEDLDKWKNFFDRQKNVFGIILSRDIAFAHHQQLYRHYCDITEVDGKIKIDFSKADEAATEKFGAPLYISVKNGVEFECEGGTMTVYEKLNDFTNYEIKRDGKNDVFIKPVSK